MSKTLRIRKAPSPAPSRAKSGTSEDRLHQTSRDLMLELEMAAIDEGGEVAVRAAEIAAGSGIAITSLYHHFGSREGLIEEAQIERILRGYREGTVVFRRAVAECSSREGFRDLVVGTIRMVATPENSPVRLSRANAIGAAFRRAALFSRIAELLDEVDSDRADVLAFAQRKGWIREDLDPKAAST